MTPFIHDDFLLHSETVRRLYHDHGAKMPIIDYHNHLNPRDIYEDKNFENLTQVWLLGDHYKWRAMRANGIPEDLVTGDAPPLDKFLAWADTVENAIGNPLYHWTHMELMRYFDIDTPLSKRTAPQIYKDCNQKLSSPDYSIRNLLRMQHVQVLCTTDDPIDDLIWHKKLQDEGFEIRVLPTFRPERALNIAKDDFCTYVHALGENTGTNISKIEGLLEALLNRLDYFISLGCCVSDHSLEEDFFVPATPTQVNQIYQKRLAGHPLFAWEAAAYRGFMLTQLGQAYAKKNLAMQLHIGALRNNSVRLFKALGPDIGCDSLHDFDYAPQLSGLLNAMDQENTLPKTILYYLNPKDAPMLAAMAGNFQSNDQGIRGKIQLGSAWWFCDHRHGMEYHLDTLSDVGLIATFIGMLTDSRSFLSFPRHEYFRRILCNKIGTLVENGEYPRDMDLLGALIENICYNNCKNYFNL